MKFCYKLETKWEKVQFFHTTFIKYNEILQEKLFYQFQNVKTVLKIKYFSFTLKVYILQCGNDKNSDK
jgi:hypothetical protein